MKWRSEERGLWYLDSKVDAQWHHFQIWNNWIISLSLPQLSCWSLLYGLPPVPLSFSEWVFPGCPIGHISFDIYHWHLQHHGNPAHWKQRQNFVWLFERQEQCPLVFNNSSPLFCNISPKVSIYCSTDILFRHSAFREAQHRNRINLLWEKSSDTQILKTIKVSKHLCLSYSCDTSNSIPWWPECFSLGLYQVCKDWYPFKLIGLKYQFCFK